MSRPNSKSLALRDPALAAMMGVIGDGDADFGAEFGDDDDFGNEFGFGADAPTQVAPSTAIAFYKKAAAAHANGQRREMLIDPNKGSAVKIQRYSFNLSDTLVLGTLKTLNITGQPDFVIRPQRVTMNAPAPGFVVVNELKIANVSVTSGGSEDAFGYSAQAQDAHLDMPTLTPANRATMLGGYTAFVPPGYVGGNAFLFSVSLRGPANLAG